MPLFNNSKNLKVSASFSIGAEAANAINTVIQLSDRLNGGDMGEKVGCAWYLSSDSGGNVISAAPQTGIAVGTDGLLMEWTNNVSGWVISEDDGDIDLTITDTGVATFYINLIMPDGKVYTSAAVTFA